MNHKLVFSSCPSFSKSFFSWRKISVCFCFKVEAVDKDGNIFPVSLWMKRIHSDGDLRCVAVIEPVQRAVGSFLFNAEVRHANHRK